MAKSGITYCSKSGFVRMKIVRAFSPGGREPACFKQISVEEAMSILAKRPHVEQFQCSFAFVDALGLQARVRVFTGGAETLPVRVWELALSESGAFIAEDDRSFVESDELAHR